MARTRGIVDTSGLEFTYTAQLRPHDLGYLIVGDALERQAPEARGLHTLAAAVSPAR